MYGLFRTYFLCMGQYNEVASLNVISAFNQEVPKK